MFIFIAKIQDRLILKRNFCKQNSFLPADDIFSWGNINRLYTQQYSYLSAIFYVYTEQVGSLSHFKNVFE